MHSRTYYRWHLHPWARTVHISILILFIIANSISLTTILFGNAYPTHASSNTWTSTADFSTWTKSNVQATNNSLTLSTTTGNGTVSTMSGALSGLSYHVPTAYDATHRKSYMFGGVDTSGGYNASIESYDVATDTVTTKSASLPVPMASGQSVWDATAGVAYIIGGFNGTSISNKIYAYDPVGDSLSVKNGTTGGLVNAATAWDPVNRVAYLFGGSSSCGGGCSSNHISKYDAVANTTSTLSVTLPTNQEYLGAVWDPNRLVAYVFGVGLSGTGIYTFDPSGPTFTSRSSTLPVGLSRFSVVWDDVFNRAYILGGNTAVTTSTNQIVEFDPADNSTNDVVTTRSATLTTARAWTGAVWDTTNDAAYILGGLNTGTGAKYSDILRFSPQVSYNSPGSASYVFTPDAGNSQDWQSASYHTTLQSQTVSVQYTTNTDCSTGLTSDITTLADSVSLCIKASLSTSNSTVSPSLDDITINYVAAGSATPTPTPSPTPTATPTIATTITTSPTVTPTVNSSASPTTTPTIGRVSASPTSLPSVAPSTGTIVEVGTATPTDSSPEAVASVLESATTPPVDRTPIQVLGSTTFLVSLLTFGMLTVDSFVILVEGIATIPQFLIGNWFNFLALIGWRKKQYPWGRVLNSVTGQPVPYVLVTLHDVNRYGRVVDRAITDTTGRFGFLAEPGNYTLRAAKVGYTFPSNVSIDTYRGTPFAVGPEKMVVVDMFIDPIDVSQMWLATLKHYIGQLEVLRIPLLVIGTILAVVNLVLLASWLNYLLVILYGILWGLEFWLQKKGRYTLQLKAENNQPLAFIVFRLVTADGKVALSKATNADGEAYVLVTSGTYILQIVLPGNIIIERTVDVTKGVLWKQMQVTIGRHEGRVEKESE